MLAFDTCRSELEANDQYLALFGVVFDTAMQAKIVGLIATTVSTGLASIAQTALGVGT